MDAKKRLQELMDERGWTMYRLAKESGTSWSTIRNVFKRGTEPSVSTLEVLCKGLGVSLAQFFDTEHALGLTREQQEILNNFDLVDPQSKESIRQLLKALAKRR